METRLPTPTNSGLQPSVSSVPELLVNQVNLIIYLSLRTNHWHDYSPDRMYLVFIRQSSMLFELRLMSIRTLLISPETGETVFKTMRYRQ